MLNFIYFAALMIIILMFLWCLKRPKTSYISEEEVIKLVEDAMFSDIIEGRVFRKYCNDEPLNDTGYVAVLEPCKCSECPCFESREDCCHTGVEIEGSRYCKTLIDINKLCGLPSVKEKPDVSKMLTDEECKLFAKQYMDASTRG